MLTEWPLFDEAFLSTLIEEFRASMRRLLDQLCDELDGPYRHSSEDLRIPVGFFRTIGASLRRDDFSNWKIVGWIEGLNDLVYLLDVQEQLHRETDIQEFAAAFYGACEGQFYEHGYFEDLFPNRRLHASGLRRRIAALCEKLARQAIHESMFLVPGVPCRWIQETGHRQWSVPFALHSDFELAEPQGCISYGLRGGSLISPHAAHGSLSDSGYRAELVISPDGMDISIGTKRLPLLRIYSSPQWQWRATPGDYVGQSCRRTSDLTLGPTLVYGMNRTPVRVISSSPDVTWRVDRALGVIETAWPTGACNLKRLTSRIIPLQARGVVSFSYRHRPGLSFLNCFDRDDFDLIDDLVHENSHHQLNLYLRKARLLQGDRNEEIFYSPWRRSLRPLRGILHATFTFTMGAILFERLSSNADRLGRLLSNADVLRARARCLEEIASVRYSFDDLDWAAERGWLTPAGIGLVDELKREMKQVAKRIARYEAQVNHSRYGSELRRHRNELTRAADLYRSGRNVIG